MGGIIQADSVRAFKPGQYVNTSDGLTGYIYGDNGGGEEDSRYDIAICEPAEERCCSARLTLWAPKAGESIFDADCEEGEVGEFLHLYGGDTCVVKWKSFPLPEIRYTASLGPVWSD